MFNKKKRFAIDAIYHAAETQLRRLDGIGEILVEAPVCRDLIDLMAPEFMDEDETATLTYNRMLLLVISKEDDSYGESIYDLSGGLRLAVAASLPKLVALAMEKVCKHSDDSDNSKEDHANNPESAVA